MNRHQIREKVMIATYQYLLIKNDMEEIIYDVFETKDLTVIDSYFATVINNITANKDDYITYINSVVDNYKFDRLGYIEQAILLTACGEFSAKELSASIIIDEAINLAKNYCDEEAYKLINVILERI